MFSFIHQTQGKVSVIRKYFIFIVTTKQSRTWLQWDGFLRIVLTIFQHKIRWWLDTRQQAINSFVQFYQTTYLYTDLTRVTLNVEKPPGSVHVHRFETVKQLGFWTGLGIHVSAEDGAPKTVSTVKPSKYSWLLYIYSSGCVFTLVVITPKTIELLSKVFSPVVQIKQSW